MKSENGLLIIACEVMGVVLLFLKIFEVISTSWFWVLAPIWMPMIYLGIGLLLKWIGKRK